MTTDPQPDGTSTLPTIVEDLFFTSHFLIKGRLAGKYTRLGKMLEDAGKTFLTVEDATMISLRGPEVIRTPCVNINRSEIIFAHELVDVAGDNMARKMASNDKNVRIRAFHSGTLQVELAGMVAPGAYEPQNSSKWYFIMEKPVVRGLNYEANPDLKVLDSLPYASSARTR